MKSQTFMRVQIYSMDTSLMLDITEDIGNTIALLALHVMKIYFGTMELIIW